MTVITPLFRKKNLILLYMSYCVSALNTRVGHALSRVMWPEGEVVDGEGLESLSQLGGLAIWICFPCLITGNAGTPGAGDRQWVALGRTPAPLALLPSCNAGGSLC